MKQTIFSNKIDSQGHSLKEENLNALPEYHRINRNEKKPLQNEIKIINSCKLSEVNKYQSNSNEYYKGDLKWSSLSSTIDPRKNRRLQSNTEADV